ncbi:hypothetical protein [Rhizobium laguerreae]|uniref:hypothetical protein n=1 Tax=Rhizobium laguerreae TaxID=1076926 RepID=UPI001C91BCB9|nr:hypothetical protein [Rhizobium laguerreae]
MSTERVRQEIARFLANERAEVLCVRGNWGTGKTYTWNTALSVAAKTVGALTSDRYAYVSLFGLNSLEDLKKEVFHNTVPRSSIGKDFSAEDVKAVYDDVRQLMKTGTTLIGRLLPDGVGEASASLAFLTIRNQMICLDDLERKGNGLRTVDVLGFVSHLKEERGCKVVLLLNDEQLEDREAFEGYLEKVVDVNLRFAPTPLESGTIALGDPGLRPDLVELVRERATKLGIDNVRVVRKLFRLVECIEPMQAQFNPEILKNVASSIVLFGWCHYQPELAPPLSFLKDKRSLWADAFGDREKKEPVDPQQETWKRLLNDYGYGYTDEFDLVLMQGVADGYFHPHTIDAHAGELHRRGEIQQAEAELRSAWHMYHYSLRNTVEDVLDGLYSCFMKNRQFYNAGNMVSLVNLFRELGDTKRSDEMLAVFVDEKKSEKGAFDLGHLHLRGEELPSDVRDAFIKAGSAQNPDYTFDEMVLRLDQEGFNSELEVRLSSFPTEEYYRVFTTYEGEELATILRGISRYLRLVNPGDAAELMMKRAGEALAVIAKDSPLNSKRALGWGLIQRLEEGAAPQQPAYVILAPSPDIPKQEGAEGGDAG